MKESVPNQRKQTLRQSSISIGRWPISFRRLGIGSVLFSCLLVSQIATAADIFLEHSFVASEGAGWGTDGSFQEKIDLPKAQIPLLYRHSKLRAEPLRIHDETHRNEVFEDQSVALYTHLHLCLDERLPKPDRNLEKALDHFLTQVAGPAGAGRLISFRLSLSNLEDITDCDVVLKQGSWDQFPYLQFKEEKKRSMNDWRNQIYGIFYRFDLNSIPVIIVHPEFHLSYDLETYTQLRDSKIHVDGRTLILHELGHLLGFAHLKTRTSAHGGAPATLMGIQEEHRTEDELRRRYLDSKEIWKHDDLYQTLLYQRILGRYVRSQANGAASDLKNLSQWRDGISFCLPVGTTVDFVTELFPISSPEIMQKLKPFYQGTDLFRQQSLKDSGMNYSDEMRRFVFNPVPEVQIRVEGMSGLEQFELQSVEFLQSGHQMQVWVRAQVKGVIATEKNVVIGVSAWIDQKYVGANTNSAALYSDESILKCRD